MKVAYYSPSWKRAGRVKTRDFMPWVTLVVDEGEADEYREKHGEPILVCPKGVQGNIARVRNYILEHSESDCIVMIDDDCTGIGYHEQREQHWLRGEALRAFFVNAFVMTEEAGTKLFGFVTQQDPKFYKENTPFSFLSVTLGPCLGIIRSGLRYDERLPLKEDYDFWLQHMHRFHRVLRFNKYFYVVGHISNPGGVTSHRTFQREIEQNRLLQKKWGRKVVRFHQTRRKRSLNPVVKVPLRGI